MYYDKEITKLIESSDLCFLGSVTEAGYPMIRAMLKPIKVEENRFYLHTNTSSRKVQQFLDNAKACLYFYNPLTFTGVTLMGEMEVVSKEAEKQAFWRDEYQIYYEKGGGLPDFTVLKFTGKTGSFIKIFRRHPFRSTIVDHIKIV